MALYIQQLSDQEVKQINALICDPEGDLPVNRLLIILYSARGKSVPDISDAVNLHPINVRKWIHRYLTKGINGLRNGKSPGRPPRFTQKQRRQIAKVAGTSPHTLGLDFSRWSLLRLHRYVIEQGVVDRISIETIRQIVQSSDLKYSRLG